MSEGIKRMLAERAALSKPPLEERLDKLEERTLARIDRAAPFIDDGCPPDKWRPSSILKIGYCTFASANRPDAEIGAVMWVHEKLQLARHRYRSGQNPNPFAR